MASASRRQIIRSGGAPIIKNRWRPQLLTAARGFIQWRRPGAEFGSDNKLFRGPKFLNDVFRKKFPFSWPKFLMTFYFFSHRPGFSNFLFIFPDFRIFTMLNVVYDPLFTRKTTISEKNSFMTPFLLCSYFRAHPTTLQIFGGTLKQQ